MEHFIWRADGHRAVLRDPVGRLAAIRALLRVDVEVLLFSVVDTHVHAVLHGADRWSRAAVSRALSVAVACRGEPAVAKPVVGRSHLQSLVRYLLVQPAHHGLELPVARYEGSCFFDLIGARLLDGFDPGAIRAHLPRLRDRDLLGIVGLDALEPLGVDGQALPALVAAARGVYGAVGRGRPAHEVAARMLAAQAARRAGFDLEAISVALATSPRTVRRALAAAPDERHWRALGLQLALRAVATTPAR
jgi:hypothetical protein